MSVSALLGDELLAPSVPPGAPLGGGNHRKKPLSASFMASGGCGSGGLSKGSILVSAW